MRLRLGAGWSEALLMETATLLEISCHGSYMLDSSVTIGAFIHKLCKWAHLYCWQFNQLVTNGLSHHYHLDESTFILGAAGVTFSFLFCILLHIHRQWNRTVYHGGDTDVPGLRRYRPDAVPVETRLLPASSRFITVFGSLPGYSRWVPVVLNILKQPGHEPF